MAFDIFEFLGGLKDAGDEFIGRFFPWLNPQPSNPFMGYGKAAPTDTDIENLFSNAETAGYHIPEYVANILRNGNPFERNQQYTGLLADLEKFNATGQARADIEGAAQSLREGKDTLGRFRDIALNFASNPLFSEGDIANIVQKGTTEAGRAGANTIRQIDESLVGRGLSNSGLAASLRNKTLSAAEQEIGRIRTDKPIELKGVNRERQEMGVELGTKLKGVDAAYDTAIANVLAGRPVQMQDFAGVGDIFNQTQDAQSTFQTIKRLTESGQFDKWTQMMMQMMGMGTQAATGLASSIFPALLSRGGGGGGGGGGSSLGWSAGIPGIASISG